MLFLDWRDDPELKRVKRDVHPSGKTGLALGIRQLETLKGRAIFEVFWAYPNMPCFPSLDLVTK